MYSVEFFFLIIKKVTKSCDHWSPYDLLSLSLSLSINGCLGQFACNLTYFDVLKLTVGQTSSDPEVLKYLFFLEFELATSCKTIHFTAFSYLLGQTLKSWRGQVWWLTVYCHEIKSTLQSQNFIRRASSIYVKNPLYLIFYSLKSKSGGLFFNCT